MRALSLSLLALLALALLAGGSSIPAGRPAGGPGAGGGAGSRATRAARSAVDSVRVVDSGPLDAQDVAAQIATAPSPRFLGLFHVFYDYEIFDASVLQRDLARVERYYRGRGFLEAHARIARVVHTHPDHVRIEIVVEPGPATLDRVVHVVGLDEVPAAIRDAATQAATGGLARGARFDE